ncbi:unnamed protein product [Periconia digitata]|uniref:Uncharacterized protein n=1 Tax=Periconia digitata TaxID=1303443 RepID=A0A9W4UBJ0_9PLEO|nr:unnamed protein product [Periconia digitata]
MPCFWACLILDIQGPSLGTKAVLVHVGGKRYLLGPDSRAWPSETRISMWKMPIDGAEQTKSH